MTFSNEKLINDSVSIFEAQLVFLEFPNSLITLLMDFFFFLCWFNRLKLCQLIKCLINQFNMFEGVSYCLNSHNMWQQQFIDWITIDNCWHHEKKKKRSFLQMSPAQPSFICIFQLTFYQIKNQIFASAINFRTQLALNNTKR